MTARGDRFGGALPDMCRRRGFARREGMKRRREEVGLCWAIRARGVVSERCRDGDISQAVDTRGVEISGWSMTSPTGAVYDGGAGSNVVRT